jgi:hypothetical protein
MEYLAYAQQLELPHCLIVAGGAIALFGIVGMFFRRSRN